MNSCAQFECDVAVIGAGPAGIAAATVAAEAGKSVVLLDDNATPGGQIWRGGNSSKDNAAAAGWLARLERTETRWCFGASVFQIRDKSLTAESANGVVNVAFEKLILATGARERFLPFPGWTLPGVLGAGGLQALIKSGLSVTGKRIVIAGTGPLLLAIAAYAKRKGAIVACVAEQTSRSKLARFGVSAFLSTQQFAQTLELLWRMRGVPYWKNAWPVAALGTTAVETVRIIHDGRQTEIACDYLACGFHLVPSTELAQLAGCRLDNGFVVVNELQQTSMLGVFCAGESTGIGGVEKSLIEGQVAGLASTGQLDRARNLRQARTSVKRHVNSMKHAFALRQELKTIAQSDTLVCRCEDVAFGRLSQHTTWRDAKLQTRCGMGPCQGKICGPAAEFLFGWETGSVRPPVIPVSCASLAAFTAGLKSESIQGGLQ